MASVGFDRPGYGASTRLLPGRGIAVVRDDAAELLDNLGLDVSLESSCWDTSGTHVARGVHKLDRPCKDADSAATADVTAYGTDHAEKLRG